MWEILLKVVVYDPAVKNPGTLPFIKSNNRCMSKTLKKKLEVFLLHQQLQYLLKGGDIKRFYPATGDVIRILETPRPWGLVVRGTRV